MDPDAALDELVTLARLAIAVANDADLADSSGTLPIEPADALRAAELIAALDYWLVGGGFWPQRWAGAPRTP